MKQFTTVKKGYNPEEVDKYIVELENTIQYYRERESAINKAVVNAEITAEKVIEEAKIKAKDMEIDALHKMNEVKEKALQTKEKLEIFQKKYNLLIQDYLVTLRSEELVQLFDQLDDINDFLEPKTAEKSLDDEDIA